MQLREEPLWLADIRRTALEKFSSMAMPLEREEEWRYTNLAKHGITNPVLEGESEVIMEGGGDGIIFEDLLSAVLHHGGLLKKYLGRAVPADDNFSAFHYANMANGIFVYVPSHGKARLSSKISGSSHTVIVVGDNGKLEYSEEYNGGGFATDVVEIFAGENSRIDFLSLQNCDERAKRFSFKNSLLDKNSRLNWYLAARGGAFHRMKINNDLQGEGAHSEMICASRSSKKQHIDFMINSNHRAPNTYCDITAKSTLDDESSGVFRGVIRIDKNAHGTDSYLGDHALLLSDRAVANNIPSLLIDANDVKAKHGATIGQVDEEQLFYMMSRGLSAEEAEQMIIDGFFEPLAAKISNTDMQLKFRQAMS
jgi:Fe-S cluster assembly protein SufD